MSAGGSPDLNQVWMSNFTPLQLITCASTTGHLHDMEPVSDAPHGKPNPNDETILEKLLKAEDTLHDLLFPAVGDSVNTAGIQIRAELKHDCRKTEGSHLTTNN